MDDWIIGIIWNERRWIVQSRSLRKLNTQLNHFCIWDDSLLQECLLQVGREIALVEHVSKLLLGEVLQILVD